MSADRGLLELGSGWVVGVGRMPAAVVLIVQYDPDGALPAHGVKSLPMTLDETRRMVAMLTAALEDSA